MQVHQRAGHNLHHASLQRKYQGPFCDFRRGTPSHDTFGKGLSRLDPRVLSERFSARVSELYFHLGRIEKRECHLSNAPRWFEDLEDWRGIAGVGWIRNTRHVDNKNDKTTTEDHYFIYSLKEAQAKDLLRIKREHWAIENNLHWMLDMAFKEDDCRARAKNAAEVMNILRKLALQMLKTCDTCKCGMRSKRKLCGLGIPTALQVLGLVPTGLLIP